MLDDVAAMAAPVAPGVAIFKLTSGRSWNALDPRPDGFELLDLAAGLARTARFGGHLQVGDRAPYSVAQHCVLGAAAMPDPIAALKVLLHDAHEALSPAVSTWLRPLPRLPV